MTKANCYVCRESVDCESLNAIHVATKYSKTRISELIQSLLADKSAVRFAADDSVCSRCLHKFNQYDLARLTAQRVEAELVRTLNSAKTTSADDSSVEDTLAASWQDDADGSDVTMADFRSYQEEYDGTGPEDGTSRAADTPAAHIQTGVHSTSGDFDEKMVDLDSKTKPSADDNSPQRTGSDQRHALNSKERLEMTAGPNPLIEKAHDLHGCETLGDVEIHSETKHEMHKSAGKIDQQRQETDWRKTHELEAWLETIDGNKKEVRCKFCRENVLALKTILIAHGRSRAHILNVSKISQVHGQGISSSSSSSCHSDHVKYSALCASSGGKRCVICGRIYDKYRDIILHFEYAHKKGKYACIICAEILPSAVHLAVHILEHASGDDSPTPMSENASESFSCDICGQREQTETKLLAHMALHDNILECLLCGKVMTKIGLFNEHMRHHKKITKKPKEKKIKSSAARYTRDKTRNHEKLCPEELSPAPAASPAQHVRIPQNATLLLSETGQIVYRCDRCHRQYSTADKLRDHFALHANSRAQAHKHIRVETMREPSAQHTLGQMTQPKTGRAVFSCYFCGHQEQNEVDLRCHWELHDNQFKCVICALVIARKFDLIQHMNIHTQKKKFQCDKCGKVFIHKTSLRAHLDLVHTTERRFECDLCSMTFKRRQDIRKHMLTHSGEKKHACSECDKRFSVRSNMRVHYNSLHLGISTSSKRHLCIICNTTFEKPSQLKLHCMKMHSRVTANKSNTH